MTLKQIWQKNWGRYLIIGGSVYLFELLVIFVSENLGANSVMAVGISFWLGLILSFLLQKLVTFRDKRIRRKIIFWQFGAFVALVIFNFLFTVIFTWLTQDYMSALSSRTIALAITTLWNFYLYKTRIFKSNNQIPDEPVIY